MSPALVLLYLLDAAGLVAKEAAGSWPASYGILPDAPDERVCLTDYGEAIDGRRMADGTVIYHPRVQVRVRARDYQTAHAKVKAIQDYLATVARTTVTVPGPAVVMVQSVTRTSGTAYLGAEEKNRRQSFSANFQVTFADS